MCYSPLIPSHPLKHTIKQNLLQRSRKEVEGLVVLRKDGHAEVLEEEIRGQRNLNNVMLFIHENKNVK